MIQLNPKRALLETLGEKYQIEPIRGLDVVAIDSKAVLYIRYNRNAGPTKSLMGKFWFGVTKSEYEKYSDQNLFVVCACAFGPGQIDYLVFPSERFDEIKADIALQSGQWKFNLLKTNERRYFLQISRKGKYDVTEFLNYFDFSPREFRKSYFPSLGEFKPAMPKERVSSLPQQPMPLEDELLMTARDSSNPKNLEVALENFFTEIGFRCKRIGGPGETDILVSEPVRFIVDGKSTKADAKSAINFTRIKRHMKENDAQFMVIVSVGFDPAVARDAEVENATLIDTQSLLSILKIHKEHVLAPYDYVEILRHSGIVTSSNLSILRRKAESQNDMVNKSLILLNNLDFIPRNLDEIKGRTDLYCEQNKVNRLGKSEIESLLAFLSHDFLKVLNQEGQKYSLRFTPLVSRERLKAIIRILCSESGMAK